MSESLLHIEPDIWPRDALEALEARFDVVYADVDDADELCRAMNDHDPVVLVVRLGIRIDERVAASSSRLAWVVTPTTGTDHLDVDALTGRGISIVTLRDSGIGLNDVRATAELTWALLLAVTRRVPAAVADVAAGRWQRRPFYGKELAGQTLGIVGYGRLGRMVAQFGTAFGMHVLVHDHDTSRTDDLPEGTVWADADSVVSDVDVLSLHLPLTESTRGWLSEQRLALMRSGAIVINTARGELVDDAAAAAAVSSGRLAGIGADVIADDANWNREVRPNPLFDAMHAGMNVVVTPHLGGYAQRSVETTRRRVTESLIRRIEGRSWLNVGHT